MSQLAVAFDGAVWTPMAPDTEIPRIGLAATPADESTTPARTGPTADAPPATDREVPRRLTAASLAEAYAGTTSRWWRERLGELVEAGAAHKVAGLVFARLADVDRWLLGRSIRRRPRGG